MTADRPQERSGTETVLQHLYAAGLELQSIRNRSCEPTTGRRLDELVTELDAITREVRGCLGAER